MKRSEREREAQRENKKSWPSDAQRASAGGEAGKRGTGGEGAPYVCSTRCISVSLVRAIFPHGKEV